MSEQLNEAVAHLRNLSTHLNDVTNQATAAVRRVEIFLNQECRLGLSVYVPVTALAPDLPTVQLGYARCGNRYRIVVRTLQYLQEAGEILRNEVSNAPIVEDEDEVAWSECPREAKLDAFQHLPALLGALQNHLNQVNERTGAAVAAAERITAVLGAAPEGGEDGGCEDGDERGRPRHECQDDERHHGHRHHGHHGHHHGRGPEERCGDDERGRHKHHGGGRFPDGQRRGGERGWDKA